MLCLVFLIFFLAEYHSCSFYSTANSLSTWYMCYHWLCWSYHWTLIIIDCHWKCWQCDRFGQKSICAVYPSIYRQRIICSRRSLITQAMAKCGKKTLHTPQLLPKGNNSEKEAQYTVLSLTFPGWPIGEFDSVILQRGRGFGEYQTGQFRSTANVEIRQLEFTHFRYGWNLVVSRGGSQLQFSF